MILMASIWVLFASFTEGFPLSFRNVVSRAEPGMKSTGSFAPARTSTPGRIIHGVVTFVCLFALAFSLGLQARSQKKNQLKFSWILVHIQSVLAVGFLISSTMIVVSLGITTQKECYASIIICLFFYFNGKICLYMFYLERVHLVRAPFIQKRMYDPIWMVGMVLIIFFFGSLTIWGYITPHAAIDEVDGQCRIGSQKIIAYIIVVFDASINALLTIIFILLLWPVMKSQAWRSTHYQNGETQRPVRHPLQRTARQLKWLMREEDGNCETFSLSIKRMLWKNAIGSGLTFLAGMANLIYFLTDEANQMAFVCFVACQLDVTFGVLIIHWLTLGGGNETPTGTTASQSSTSTTTIIIKPEPAVLSIHDDM